MSRQRTPYGSGLASCSSTVPLPAEPLLLLRRPQRPAAAGRDFAAGRGPAAQARAAAAGAASAAAAAAAQADEVLKLVHLLPPAVRQQLRQHPELPQLLEVVMDLGRPPLARFPGGDVRLAEAAVSPEDLQYAVRQVGLWPAAAALLQERRCVWDGSGGPWAVLRRAAGTARGCLAGTNCACPCCRCTCPA